MVLAIVFFVGARFVIPSVFSGSHDFGFQVMSLVAPVIAWVGLLLLIPAGLLTIRSLADRRLQERQRDLGDIRALSWQRFESLIAEAYRRQGYSVQRIGGAGPDGGVDLVLKKDGNKLLVQCKQWKTRTIGINVVCEMFGMMSAQHAHGAIILTSGLFTEDARTFAAGKPIDLIEGQQLLALVRAAQGTLASETPRLVAGSASPPPQVTSKKFCPTCGAEMILRIAKIGPGAGQQFWGCSRFPACRATESFKGK